MEENGTGVPLVRVAIRREGEHMKKISDIWQDIREEENAKLVNAHVTGHADAEARRSVVTALRGEHMKKISDIWRDMSEEDKAKWRSDGEEGCRVPGSMLVVAQKAASQPSSYQMFVKQMSKEFKARDPESKQADNMKKIGELWREMGADDKQAWKCEDESTMRPTNGSAAGGGMGG
ncbi:hypothetical protein T484DRAFT_1901021, partial [Baffinella frigidus]